MVKTKTFNTRLQLKYDTYENWFTNNPVLLKGEIAIATISNATDDTKHVPSVMLKVGDGTNKYNDLKFVSGMAANVSSWALAANKPEYQATEINGLTDFIAGEMQDTNTTYQIVKVTDYSYKLQYKENAGGVWTDVPNAVITIPKYDDKTVKDSITALQALVGDTAVAEQITSAITELDLTNTYETKGAAAQALSDAKTYADGKDVAIAEAKKAGTDAQTQVADEKVRAEAAEKLNKNAIDTISADYLKSTDKTELQGNINTLSTKVTSNTSAIGILNGTGEGSVDKKITDAINEFATNITDDGVVNSYKELIDYVATHGSEFTELVGKVDTNTNAVDTLNGTGEGSVDKKITDAITPINGKIGKIEGDITELQSSNHTHDNKDVLDGITAGKVSNWDSAKTVADKAAKDIGTVTSGKTVVQMIEEAETSALTDSKAYTDELKNGAVKTNTDNITAVDSRVTALESKALQDGDTLILACGNSVIA